MIRVLGSIFLLTLLLSACISESELKPILPMQIIHSNSAKVWILESKITNGEEQAPRTREFKKAFTFYDDGVFIEQNMINLGSSKGLRGNYFLITDHNSTDTIFNLYYQNKTDLNFRLKLITPKQIIMQKVNTEGKNQNIYWTLETLPKPIQ